MGVLVSVRTYECNSSENTMQRSEQEVKVFKTKNFEHHVIKTKSFHRPVIHVLGQRFDLPGKDWIWEVYRGGPWSVETSLPSRSLLTNPECIFADVIKLLNVWSCWCKQLDPIWTTMFGKGVHWGGAEQRQAVKMRSGQCCHTPRVTGSWKDEKGLITRGLQGGSSWASPWI